MNISFEEMALSPSMLESLKRLGFSQPTPVQQHGIPSMLEGKNVVAQAHTGSGKTLGFAVPILERTDPVNPSTQVLILAPTRELVLQICQVFWDVRPQELDVRVVPVYGGSPKELQRSSMRQGSQVLVATPGRFIDFLWEGEISLEQVRIVILDEADRMLELGFIEDVEFILSCLRHEVQFGLFSATIPPPVERIIRKYVPNPHPIRLGHLKEDKPKINEIFHFVHPHEKLKKLVGILGAHRTSTLIFCRTRDGADRLAEKLERSGLRAAAIHGGKEQSRRDYIMRGFRKGQLQILVATDLASRGLDIDRVGRVINYDVPLEPEDYVHRIGRTARAGKEGLAITLVTPGEQSLAEQIRKSRGGNVSVRHASAQQRAAG